MLALQYEIWLLKFYICQSQVLKLGIQIWIISAIKAFFHTMEKYTYTHAHTLHTHTHINVIQSRLW